MNTKTAKAWITVWLLLTNLTLFGQVTADFSADKTESCSPLVTRFTNLSTGNITSTKWIFGNNNVSYQTNPGAVYLQSGYKTVTLIVSDGVVSDTMTKVNFIHVFDDPIADLQANITKGCAPFQVCFTDMSIPGSGAISGWIWDFGNGSSSTDQNPCVTYDQQGTYDITLLVIDSNGCESMVVYPGLIQATSDVVAEFSVNANSACNPPLLVQFDYTGTHYPGQTYRWNMGDGTTDNGIRPSHNYTTAGQFDVSLIVTNSFGCADTLLQPGFIALESLDADFTSNVTGGCVGTPVQFTDLSTSNPTYHFWKFGDGQTDSSANPQHVYNSPGTYTVKLVASNNGTCIDSVVKTSYITISAIPQASFTGNNLTGCKTPHQVNFTDASTGAVSWSWDFGNGATSTQKNPSYSYDSNGVYTVSLTVKNAKGCANTYTLNDYINLSSPEVAFYADVIKGCVPLEVNFGDSSISQQNIVSWSWDFGDGFTSTQQHPQHTYTNTGIYDVRLIIINNEGCTDTLLRENFIRAGNKPSAAFTTTSTDICLFGSVTFSDNSTGNVNEWYWDFGDNNTSIDENPTYAWSDTGLFTIMFIPSHNGCKDTLVIDDYIHVSPPDARAAYIQDCATPYEIEFIDNSIGPDTWSWDFGDGTTTTNPNPTHTFPSRGIYNVALTVTHSATGCYDIDAFEMHITDPLADFSADTTIGCHPFTVNFDNASLDGDKFLWKTAGMTSTDTFPEFVYTVPGTYDVSLIITDVNGCSDTLVRPNYITVLGPTAKFFADPLFGCAPLDVNFTDTSIAYLSPIIGWQWAFGDGDSSTAQHPFHRYDSIGQLSVTLTVEDGNGCFNTLQKANYIKPTFPSPAFLGDTLSCVGGTIELYGTSIGTGLTHVWDFGDGKIDTATNPIHLYDSLGTYTITLKVIDQNGCDSTIVVPNYVTIAEPVANFNADSTFSPCPPLVVNFENQSSSNIVSYFWDFGDGKTSNLKDPSHVYLSPGNFTVTMVGYTAKGCADTLIQNDLIVVLGPTGTFTFETLDGCLGNEILFEAVTQNTVSRDWDFGDGTILNAGDTVVHNYDSNGVYHPVIVLDDGQGCLFAIGSEDSIVVGELHADFVADKVYVCDSGRIIFNSTSTGTPPILTYKWFVGDGTYFTSPRVIKDYFVPGVHDIMLIVSNGFCVDTMLKEDYLVIGSGADANFNISDPNGCVPQTVAFTDLTVTDSLIDSYFWDFGNGVTDSVQNTTQQYPDTGTYNVTLIVNTIKGCTDTISKPLRVNPIPVLTTTVDTSICFGETIELGVTGASTYVWNPGNGLSNDSISNPLASPTSFTNYVVTGTDVNGCIGYDSVAIGVKALPVISAGPDREICLGESVELNGTGGGTYAWTPNNTLDCFNCSTVVATPTVNTNYTLWVQDSLKCRNTDTVTVTVHELPLGILNADTAICDGEPVQLVADGGVFYAWGPEGSLSCKNCPNPLATPDSTTLYQATVINQYNCEVQDSIEITVHPNPVPALFGPSEMCATDTVQVHATGGAQYNWAGEPYMSCTNCADPFISPDSTTTYNVTVSSSFGCTTDATYKIVVRPLPSVSTIEDLTLCNGDVIVLQTEHTLGASFVWTPAASLSDSSVLSPIASPQTTTTYTVDVFSQHGCVATDAVTIKVIDKVEVVLPDSVVICNGENVQITGEVIAESYMGTQYVWNPVSGINNANSLDQVFNPRVSTTYTQIAYSGSCIPDTNRVFVGVHQNPLIVAEPQLPVVEGTQIILGYTGPDNIVSQSWTPNYNLDCDDCAAPSFVATQDEVYHLAVVDEFGCEAELQIPIRVVGVCGEDFYVPNSFSPNGDGHNDLLKLRGRGISSLVFFRVFDRWGNQVFETKDIDEGWNGLYNGKRVDQAVFVYYYEAVCTNGYVVSKKGNVTVLK